jgi:hypothetical protein
MAITFVLFLCFANALAAYNNYYGFSIFPPDNEYYNREYRYTIVNNGTMYRGIDVMFTSLPFLMDKCSSNIDENTTDNCNVKFHRINERYNLATADRTKNNPMMGHMCGRYYSYFKPPPFVINARIVTIGFCFHEMLRSDSTCQYNNRFKYILKHGINDCILNPLCIGVATYAGYVGIKYPYTMIFSPPYKCAETVLMVWTSKEHISRWGLLTP